MPTLEERTSESTTDLRKRLTARTRELNITYSFAEYMELMEVYLLKLERRVLRLEKSHNLDSNDTIGATIIPKAQTKPKG